MSETTAPRKAYRDPEAGAIGGVAAGLAVHLGWPILLVRIGFVLLSVFHGLGILLYAALWIFLPSASPAEVVTEDAVAPGTASATRGGRRPRAQRRFADLGLVVALSVVGFGFLIWFNGLGGHGALFWVALVGVAGIGLIWRQADQAQRERWLDASGRVNPWRMVIGRGNWAAWARLLLGVGLILSGFLLLMILRGAYGQIGGMSLAFALGLFGIGVVLAPWIMWLVSDLGTERAERIRSQERADVAAHLHDSVLQTLALIQRNAEDPSAVTRLARAQERDLRTWLFEAPGPSGAKEGGSFADAVRAVAAEAEDLHGVPVEVVVVGDRECDDRLRALVAATREAVTNASQHSGASKVDVFAEVTAEKVEVFVKDRGAGFQVKKVDPDRHGIRDSIVGRVERQHGTVVITSSRRKGTEIKMEMPL